MLAKSILPSTRPNGGMMMPSTRSVTILPKAAPMMTPTARSMTLPRAMKSRNCLATDMRALWRGCLRHHDRRRGRHRVEVVQEALRFRRVVLFEVVRPPVADRLIQQLHADAERTAIGGDRDRVVHRVAVAREVGIL